MRHAFWVLVIAFAISALSGGFLSGRAAVPHFPAATPGPVSQTPSPSQALTGAIPQTDEMAEDDFAADAAVTADTAAGDVRQDARLAVVIVDTGHSPPLESPFLSLGVPVTAVIDANAPAAVQIARIALQNGQRFYVQAHAPLTAAQIESLRAAFPRASGVAARFTDAQAPGTAIFAALRAARWSVLDEYGPNAALARAFAKGGVRYAARSITVDDHLQQTYVAYMLRQAVHLARGRTAVVMGRPFPGTLQAFEDLLTQASRDGVRFVRSPS